MHTICHTSCAATIKNVLAIDNMYDNLVYDGSPDFNYFFPDVKNKLWLVLLKDANTAGLIIFEYVNNVMWNCHISILEQYRGNGSEEWAIKAAQYMREVYKAEKFLAITPYIAAKKYAEKAGFTQVAVLKNSIRKNGKLLDQYMMEL